MFYDSDNNLIFSHSLSLLIAFMIVIVFLV